MTTAVIVQARMGSTRFPGKVLKPLGVWTVLEEVLHRCRSIAGVDVVVCAIPDTPEDDVLIPVIKRSGAVVSRGPSDDVLARYAVAASKVNADTVMRVTSDCPLIDPGLCADVLALRVTEGADYACNNMPPTFPHGLDCEAFTAKALQKAATIATDPAAREHVTPWLRSAAELTRVNLCDPVGAAVNERWTLDYPEDYAFMQQLFTLLPDAPVIPTWREVIGLLASRPDISAINASRRASR